MYRFDPNHTRGMAYLIPITYLLTHGAEPFLRSRQLCSYSKTSQYFTEPEDPSTGPYPEPDCLSKGSVQVRGFLWHFVTSIFLWWVVSHNPYRLPSTASSTYLNSVVLVRKQIIQTERPPLSAQLPSISGGRLLHPCRAVVTRDSSHMVTPSHRWRKWKELTAASTEHMTSKVSALLPSPTSAYLIIWNLKSSNEIKLFL
jgi:hypothetical protein